MWTEKTWWILLHYNPPKNHHRWNLKNSRTMEKVVTNIFHRLFRHFSLCLDSFAPLARLDKGDTSAKPQWNSVTSVKANFIRTSRFVVDMVLVFVFKSPFHRKGFRVNIFFLAEKKREPFGCFFTNLIGLIKNNLLEHQRGGKHEGCVHLSFVHGFI